MGALGRPISLSSEPEDLPSEFESALAFQGAADIGVSTPHRDSVAI